MRAAHGGAWREVVAQWDVQRCGLCEVWVDGAATLAVGLGDGAIVVVAQADGAEIARHDGLLGCG